jgi:hypothetical protein
MIIAFAYEATMITPDLRHMSHRLVSEGETGAAGAGGLAGASRQTRLRRHSLNTLSTGLAG